MNSKHSSLPVSVCSAVRRPLPLDARGLGAVVYEALAEPGVLERLLGGDAFGRVVHEYLAEKVEELPVEVAVRGNDVLLDQRGHGRDSGNNTSSAFIALT